MASQQTRDNVAACLGPVRDEPYKLRLTYQARFAATLLVEMGLRHHDAEIVRLKNEKQFAEGVADLEKYHSEQLAFHHSAHQALRYLLAKVIRMKIGIDKLPAVADAMEGYFPVGEITAPEGKKR